MTTYDEPLVETAPVEEVLAAIESADLDAPWEKLAPNLRVALQPTLANRLVHRIRGMGDARMRQNERQL